MTETIALLLDSIIEQVLSLSDKSFADSLYTKIDYLKSLLQPKPKCYHAGCRNFASVSAKYKAVHGGFLLSLYVPACKKHFAKLNNPVEDIKFLRFHIGDTQHAYNSNPVTEIRMESETREMD